MPSLTARRSDRAYPSPDTRQTVPLLPGQWLAIAIGLTFLADAALLHRAHLSVAVSFVSLAYGTAILLAGSLRFALRMPATREQRIARDLVEGLLAFVTICLLGAVASYPLALLSHGFVDEKLQKLDLLVNFDWLSLYRLVARHSWMQFLGRAAYLSIYITPAVLIGYWARSGSVCEMRLFLATYWVAALATLCVFPLMPAAGPLSTLWHGAAPYMPLSALYQDQVIGALRNGAVSSVDLGALHGIVCAPSFHAVSAVVYTATAWRSARLRWPIAILNAAMLLATPIEGTHYLIDIVIGMLVAIFALAATPALIRIAERHRLEMIDPMPSVLLGGPN